MSHVGSPKLSAHPDQTQAAVLAYGRPAGQGPPDPHATLAHHYDTPRQQFDAAKVGMWVFLATEILMFGGLFVAYSVWRANHPEVFLYAHTQLKWPLGAINTVFLIGSSFTMALAVRAAQLNQKHLLKALLLATIGGGCLFLVVKAFEYHDKYQHYLMAGRWNRYQQAIYGGPEAAARAREHIAHAGGHGQPHAGETGHAAAAGAATGPSAQAATQPAAVAPDGSEGSKIPHAAAGPPGLAPAFAAGPGARAAPARHSLAWEELPAAAKARTHQFFQIYFLMTGLHTLHVIVGIGLLSWILLRAMGHSALGVGFSSAYYTPVDLVGLYWHLVDLIWIFLFPLLYLIH